MSRKSKKKANRVNQSGSKYEARFLKYYDDREADVLREKSSDDLLNIVAKCQANVMRVAEELEENSDYQAAKEVLKDFKSEITRLTKEAEEDADYQSAKAFVEEFKEKLTKTIEEAEGNSEYLEAKETVKAVKASLKEAKDFQDAKQLFCVSLLHGRGVVDAGITSNLFEGVEITFTGAKLD